MSERRLTAADLDRVFKDSVAESNRPTYFPTTAKEQAALAQVDWIARLQRGHYSRSPGIEWPPEAEDEQC